MMTAEDVLDLEPNLILDGVQGGLLSRDEYVVDSWLLPLSNLYSALCNGCDLETDCQVLEFQRHLFFQHWEVKTSKGTLTHSTIQ